MFKKMLVPIDGTNASATVVPYAGALAQRLGCRVDIVLVEPSAGARLPHPDHHRPTSGVRSGELGRMAIPSTTPAHIREANERYSCAPR